MDRQSIGKMSGVSATSTKVFNLIHHIINIIIIIIITIIQRTEISGHSNIVEVITRTLITRKL